MVKDKALLRGDVVPLPGDHPPVLTTSDPVIISQGIQIHQVRNTRQTPMEGGKLTIKLTEEQQKLIKDATGRSITELSIDTAGISALSEEELEKVSGGRRIIVR
jgi:hypothetical protein